ncbi:uncharacterized protein BKA55DRAFT_654477 [Fusarium redolens]|uniref:F-box domain-containing protein n=1 Tax=Fusarium redolens TaxID=48865 RepID=A0A9P9FZG8_FUSRE|nr:uncharacterized protein BKA55DRAFT_654477 [Fusarium redolens]KAH7230515.1 hypothetical protein BKA55DRAFT_654477 [Fusarium redolens]
MASIIIPNTDPMSDPSSITENTTASMSPLLRTCFYKRSKYYFPTVDPKVHEFSHEVHKLFSQCFGTPTSDLGALACLPQDLLGDIVLKLDIDSFRRFRQVSRRARCLATDLPIYQRVLHYAPDALNAFRRTGLSCYVSYADVYNALMTSTCAFCGLFGNFLFLPTAKRCCFECLRISPETAVVNEARISKRDEWRYLYNERAEDLAEALKTADMCSFKTHNWDDVQKMSKTRGVLAKDLLAVYIKVDKVLEKTGQALLKPGWLHYRLAASLIFPSLNSRTGKLETGVSCKGCHVNHMRQGPSLLVPLPTFRNMFTVWCRTRDMSYSEKNAASHLSECLEAQRLWREKRGFYYLRGNTRRREQEN